MSLGRLDELLNDPTIQNLPKNIIFYNQIVNACSIGQDLNQANYFYEEMKTRSIQPDTIFANNYLKVLKSCSSDLRTILYYYKEFSQICVPDVRTKNTFISLLSDHGKFHEVLNFALKMEIDGEMDWMTPNIIAEAYGQLGNIEQVLKYLQKYDRVEMFTSLMKALAKLNLFHQFPNCIEKFPQFSTVLGIVFF